MCRIGATARSNSQVKPRVAARGQPGSCRRSSLGLQPGAEARSQIWQPGGTAKGPPFPSPQGSDQGTNIDDMNKDFDCGPPEVKPVLFGIEV